MKKKDRSEETKRWHNVRKLRKLAEEMKVKIKVKG